MRFNLNDLVVISGRHLRDNIGQHKDVPEIARVLSPTNARFRTSLTGRAWFYQHNGKSCSRKSYASSHIVRPATPDEIANAEAWTHFRKLIYEKIMPAMFSMSDTQIAALAAYVQLMLATEATPRA
jgi:hypothetical protein